MTKLVSHLLGILLLFLSTTAHAALVISEIADKGSGSDTCDGEDWIELFNNGAETVSLADHVLHDDKGVTHEEAYAFGDNVTIGSNEYLVLCTKLKVEDGVADPSSPQFGIGGSDTISLVRKITGADATSMTVELVDSVGPLPNTANSGTSVPFSYALNPATNTFEYTSTPTPRTENIITAIPTEEELLANLRAQLKAQNEMGTNFFGMDARGYPVQDEGFPVILDLHVSMTPENFETLTQNATWEVYRPFENATLKNPDTGEELWSRTLPGRIRTKGQSTLYIGVCLGTSTIPFQLDLSTPDGSNIDQTLFGVEKLYLRNHMQDYSFMRDQYFHRMLARFGLPHARARKAQLYINGELMGFYTLIEAPDQPYVFARNYPDYNPQNFALYKVKSYTLGCGAYTEEEYRNATIRAEELERQAEVNDGKYPPYAFERGEHQPAVEVHGLFGVDDCQSDFLTHLYRTWVDVVVLYDKHGQDCGEMLVEEGIVDLDLGTRDYDNQMKDFLNEHFRYDERCDAQCANKDIAAGMDVDHVLKTLAFYAALVVSDSPLISGNNFYLAQTGDGAGWKIQAYDFNVAGVVFCENDLCNARAPHWSILRPTCESLEEQQLIGPLLSDPDFQKQYLDYAREFVDTVLTNSSLLAEMEAHVNAIAPYMRGDFWSVFGAHVDKELSPDAANWRDEDDRFPLLPTMKARAEDLKAQFAAIDAGTFPRGPHLGVEGDNEPWEVCPDWRATEANRTACEMDCMYEGCHRPDYTVPSFCDEVTGKCSHGNLDERCHGLYDFERYDGMKDTEDGRPTFCRFAAGVPVKAAECPAPGALTSASGSSDDNVSSASPAAGQLTMLILFSGLLFQVL